jgi:hypothetical protein
MGAAEEAQPLVVEALQAEAGSISEGVPPPKKMLVSLRPGRSAAS